MNSSISVVPYFISVIFSIIFIIMVFYALFLSIKALRIYIKKNS